MITTNTNKDSAVLTPVLILVNIVTVSVTQVPFKNVSIPAYIEIEPSVAISKITPTTKATTVKEITTPPRTGIASLAVSRAFIKSTFAILIPSVTQKALIKALCRIDIYKFYVSKLNIEGSIGLS